MKPAVLALRRRSFVEQRVVRLLRVFADRRNSAVLNGEIAALGFTSVAVRRLERLVKQAAALGYEFKPLLSPFVAAGELRLVGLLAQAQRTNVDHPVAVEGELRDMLIACAAVLDAAGVHLPPLTMVSAQLPAPATIIARGRT